MKMTKGLLAAFIGLSVSAFGAYRKNSIIAHWTGAADKMWDNPANWEVEGLTEADAGFHAVPGVLKDAEGNYTGSKADQAVFDRATDNTSLKIGTLVCISNVTFKGAAIPKFTFAYPFRMPMVDGSTLKVEADVVNVPSLYQIATGIFRTKSTTYFTLVNDAADVLTVSDDIGWNKGTAACDPFSGFTSNSTTYMYLKGKGDVSFGRYFPRDKSNEFNFYIQQSGTAKFSVRASESCQLRSWAVSRPDDTDQLIEVPANYFGDYAAGYSAVAIDSNTKITGAGTYHCGYGTGRNNTTTVAAGKLFWNDCKIISKSVGTVNPPSTGAAFKKDGAGTMRVTSSESTFPGMVELSEGVLEANGIGLAGEASALGTCGTAVGIATGARFRYIGAGETTDKGFRVATDGSSEFEHAGTGDLTFSSATPFTATSTTKAHAVKLFNDSGFRGIFASGLTTDDANQTLDLQSGVWQFTGANTFTGTVKANAGTTVELAGSGSFVTPLALAGSKVRVIGGDEAATVWSFAFANASGTSTIEVEGKAAITITDASVTAGSVDFVVPSMDDVSIVFTGKTSASETPVGVTVNGFALRFDDGGKASYDDHKITGDRDVEVSGWARYDLLCPDNDYTGKTILHGGGGAWIYAMWPGSIPDYAKTEVYGGRITVPLMAAGYGTAAWTDAKILDLANSAKLATNAVIAVDTTTSGDHTIALSDANVTSDAFGIGSDGANKLTVTGAPSRKVNFASFNGTLEFKGNKGLKLGAGNLSGDPGTGNFGTVVLDGVDASISDDNQPIYIGGRKDKTEKSGTSQLKDYCGRLVIKDSRLSNSRLATTTTSTYNFVLGGSSSGVGQGGPGVMEISGETTVVTATFNVATFGYKSQGAIYQSGGTVVDWAHSANNASPKNYFSYMGNAYYELTGGTFMQLGSMRWAGNQGTIDATMVQRGGSALFTTRGNGNMWAFGCGGNPSSKTSHADVPVARYLVFGGTTKVEGLSLITCHSDGGNTWGLAEFAVDGPDASFELAASVTPTYSDNPHARTSFFLNNGGTLITAKPMVLSAKASAAGNNELVVGFNGGRIRATADLQLFGNSAEDVCRVTRAIVYEKGAIFDTNGKTVELYAPLSAPTGMGIRSAKIDESVNTEYGTLVAPVGLQVMDGAGGLDGSLFAEFDLATHSVTNVRVISPGSGYTSAPNAVVRIASSSKSGKVTLEMEELVGGGLVKTGAGTLVLGVANTYAGDTVVSNGVLKLAADGALANPTVKLCGGSLDVADGISYPAGLTLDVSGVPTAKATTLAENWTSDTLPTLVGVADGWRVDKVGTRLRHHRDIGLILIVK